MFNKYISSLIFMEARVGKHFKVWIDDIYTAEGILLFCACSTHKLAQKHIHGSYSQKTFQGANRLCTKWQYHVRSWIQP